MDPRCWEANSKGLEGCEDMTGTGRKGQSLGLMFQGNGVASVRLSMRRSLPACSPQLSFFPNIQSMSISILLGCSLHFCHASIFS